VYHEPKEEWVSLPGATVNCQSTLIKVEASHDLHRAQTWELFCEVSSGFDTEVSVKLARNGAARSVEFRVISSEGMETVFDVEMDSQVSTLKASLEDTHGIAPRRQTLSLGATVLKDDMQIGDICVNGSTLRSLPPGRSETLKLEASGVEHSVPLLCAAALQDFRAKNITAQQVTLALITPGSSWPSVTRTLAAGESWQFGRMDYFERVMSQWSTDYLFYLGIDDEGQQKVRQNETFRVRGSDTCGSVECWELRFEVDEDRYNNPGLAKGHIVIVNAPAGRSATAEMMVRSRA
jgi:hypothetical protein